MSITRPLLLAALLLALPAARAGTLVELSAEASRPATNDRLQAIVYVEANAANPADVAQKVNQDLGQALRLVKSRPAISVKSGSQHTYPVYGNNRRIDGWRMRAELILETQDGPRLAELLAELQQMKLALASLNQSPSAATRRAVETAVARDAIHAFQERAALIADTLGKGYRIKRLSVQQNGSPPPMPMLRAAKMEMAGDFAAAPLEAGETQLTTTVSGEIELAD